MELVSVLEDGDSSSKLMMVVLWQISCAWMWMFRFHMASVFREGNVGGGISYPRVICQDVAGRY